MEFGLFNLMPQRDAAKSPREIFAETVEQVRLAEDLGFDVAWFAEHHFSNYCLCPSPIAMAIHLAGLTRHIRLGTGVVVAPLYQPLRMLEDLALLDILSDGRLVIGLGSGYQQYEFHKFGVNVASGRDIFLETLDVLEQFLAEGVVEYGGKHASRQAAVAAHIVTHGRYARLFWFGAIWPTVAAALLGAFAWGGASVALLALAGLVVQPALIAYESVFVRAGQDPPLS